MCTDPALLCLDRPAAGLNARESAGLSELLLSIRADLGTSILLIEHDMSVVMEITASRSPRARHERCATIQK